MSDYMIRAVAAEGKIRAFAAYTTDTVEEARRRHNTSPVITAALGRLLTAAAMMGSMMKGDRDRVMLKINGDGPVKSITAQADTHGRVRGFAAVPQVILHANAKGKLDVGGAVGNGVLTVTKDIGMREPYVGTTMLVSGEIAEDLTYYFAESEQVPSSVGLGVLMNRENTVRQAGGFIVQLMPGVDDEVISRLEERIRNIDSVTSMLDRGMSPEDILNEILEGFSPEQLGGRTDIAFSCGCSKEKIRSAVSGLKAEELESLIEGEQPVTAHCDFCNTDYTFTPDEIRAIIAGKTILQ